MDSFVNQSRTECFFSLIHPSLPSWYLARSQKKVSILFLSGTSRFLPLSSQLQFLLPKNWNVELGNQELEQTPFHPSSSVLVSGAEMTFSERIFFLHLLSLRKNVLNLWNMFIIISKKSHPSFLDFKSFTSDHPNFEMRRQNYFQSFMWALKSVSNSFLIRRDLFQNCHLFGIKSTLFIRRRCFKQYHLRNWTSWWRWR